jgi:hypothetical protein
MEYEAGAAVAVTVVVVAAPVTVVAGPVTVTVFVLAGGLTVFTEVTVSVVVFPAQAESKATPPIAAQPAQILASFRNSLLERSVFFFSSDNPFLLFKI